MRRSALRIIAYFGYPSGLDPLIEATRDADARIRDVALQGLAFIDDPRSLEVLLGASAHASAVRARRGHARARPHRPAATPRCSPASRGASPIRTPGCATTRASRSGSWAARSPLDRIVALLDDEAGQVRVAAVEALARIGTDRAALALHRAAGAADPDLARAALLGLGDLHRLDALPLMVEALRSPDRSTRLMALAAAAALQAPEVLELLAHTAADDGDDDVRRAAIGQLAAKSDAAATLALTSLLAEPRARKDVVDALVQAHERRGPALLTALETADEVTAPLLVGVLARSPEPAQGARGRAGVERPLRPARRRRRARRAGRPRDAARRWSEVLAQDPDAEVQRLAAAALGPR